MDYKIIWTPRSLETLEKVVTEISRSNPDAARKLGSKLLKSVVFYQIKEAPREVWVLTVWHGARQEPELPIAV